MKTSISDEQWGDILERHADGHIFVAHSSTVWQNKGSDKTLREQMIASGADPKRANVTFTRMENQYTTRFNKARRQAKEVLEENGMAWSTKKRGEARNSNNVGGFLIRIEDWREISEQIQKAFEAWETAIMQDVIQRYPDHVTDGMRAYRALTKGQYEMSEAQLAKHYPPVDEVRAKFTWDVYKEGVNTDTPSHEQLKGEHSELFRSIAEDAVERQKQGVCNVIEDLVGDVMALADKQSNMIRQYDPDTENQRDGNTLPYKNDWEKLPQMAKKLEDWERSFYGGTGPMADLAGEVRSLHKRLTNMSGDDMGEMRGILGGEDSSARDEVSERLDDLGDTASSVLGKMLLS